MTLLIQSQAPGKVIIAGEHAVVAECPAIATTINRHATTTIKPASNNLITVNLTDFNEIITLHSDELQNIEAKVTKPSDLALFTILKALPLKLEAGLDITIKSNIPIGRGLGSSAAIIISILFAINHYFQLNWSEKEILERAIVAENLQHGKSSGLDLKISLLGGEKFPSMPFQFIDTGKPTSSTGDCVLHTQPQFTQDPSLVKQFEEVVINLKIALQKQDKTTIISCIKQNHALLTQIGVIPKKVQEFINEIEKHGLAGKICGAGSIAGDNAGIVLIAGNNNIDDIINQFGYKKLDLQEQLHGAIIL